MRASQADSRVGTTLTALLAIGVLQQVMLTDLPRSDNLNFADAVSLGCFGFSATAFACAALNEHLLVRDGDDSAAAKLWDERTRLWLPCLFLAFLWCMAAWVAHHTTASGGSWLSVAVLLHPSLEFFSLSSYCALVGVVSVVCYLRANSYEQEVSA